MIRLSSSTPYRRNLLTLERSTSACRCIEVRSAIGISSTKCSKPTASARAARPLLQLKRDQERQILLDDWESLSTDDPTRIVLIQGPAGVGKSTLASCLHYCPNLIINRFDPLQPKQPFFWKDALPQQKFRPNLTTPSMGSKQRLSRMRVSLRSVATKTIWLVEDLHHADAAALEILKDVVKNKPANVLFVGTCEIIPDALMASKELESMKVIHLENLNLESVKKMIPSEPLLAEEIYQQSKGNPLYASELIRSRDLMDYASLEALYRANAAQLGNNLQQVLQVAACFGQTVKKSLLEIATNSSFDLKKLVASGMVRRVEDQYFFSHECIQNTFYGMVKDPVLTHLTIGRKVWSSLSEDGVKDNIFVVLNQLWWGKDLLSDQEEKYGIASLCHFAAEAAVRATNFALALQLLNWGMDLLGKNPWRAQYDLSLAIYNGTCEISNVDGDFERVQDLLGTIEKHGRTFHDKLNVRMTYLSGLSSTNCMATSLTMGDVYLKELKVKPLRTIGSNMVNVLIELTTTRASLRTKSNDFIMGLPHMRDPDHLSTMQIMCRSLFNSYLIDPRLSVHISIRMLRMTLNHGLCSFACVCFASFGTILAGLRAIDEANRIADIALHLLEKFQTHEWIARVHLFVYGFIKPWKAPLVSTLEPLYHAYRRGLEEGDNEFAIFDATFYALFSFNAGLPLAEIEKKIEGVKEAIENSHSSVASLRLLPFLQLVSNLMGRSEDPRLLDGDIVKHEDVMRVTAKKTNKPIEVWNHFDQELCAYLFGDFELAARSGKVARRLFGVYHPGIDIANIALIDGLTSLELYRQGKNKRFHILNARKHLKRLKKVAYKTPQNCLGKYYLLHAQLLATTTTDREKTSVKFVASIALFDQSDLTMERGLSNCLFASFLESNQEQEAARSHFQLAASIYDGWGAVALVDHLSKTHSRYFPQRM